jgi:uncharacterized phage protein gp47/JayE
MVYGVTPAGFVPKRLADIKLEQEAALQGIFGAGIDLDPRGPFGQLVGIYSERESLLWELFEQLYNASYVRWAEDVSLQNAVAYNGIVKQKGTKSTVGIKCIGTAGTTVPALSVVSVEDNTDARFVTDADILIGAGTSEVQTITFSGTPVGGTFTLVFDGESTSALAHNVSAAAVKAALEALSTINTVNVTGTVGAGFVVTFAGADAEQPKELITVGSNTLSSDGVAVGDITPSIAETTPGALPNGTGTATAESVGATIALAGKLTVIETAVSGWDSVTNPLDATLGLEPESDAELKIRRVQQIAKAGAGTPEAIKAKILELEDVTSCTVYINKTKIVDGDGRPPNSVEAVVEGGTDAEIAEKLWKAVGGGIATHGTETVIHVDEDGFNQTMKFSRPTEVDIHIILDIDVTDEFPISSGADDIKAAIVEWGADLQVGDDVIVFPKLVSVLNNDEDYPGIVDVTVKIGTAALPTLSDNITISNSQRAKFDTSRITINVTVV